MTPDWEGGDREGIRWRRVGLVVLVVVVVAGIYASRRDRGIAIETDGAPVVATTETAEIVVIAPLRVGTRWYCPDDFPVHIRADGSYFPHEYPRGGHLLERPQSCYSDAARAEQDGYQLADPPPDTIVAGGVYLERPNSPSEAACKGMASTTGFAVPCPTWLPTPAIGPSCFENTCLYGDEFSRELGTDRTTGVVIEQRQFRRPPSWPADAHVVLAAAALAPGDGGGTRVLGTPEIVSCSPEAPVILEEHPVFFACPPSQDWVPRIQGDPHEEHTAAFWRRGDTGYAASVEGEGPQVRALLEAIIDGIRYVGP